MKQPNIEEMPAWDEMMQKFLDKLPIEQRLAGLAPEERLSGLAPEERLSGLDRDHQAVALPVEVLSALSEEYIGSLAPEIQEEIRRRLRSASR
jgi:hypothetical protein